MSNWFFHGEINYNSQFEKESTLFASKLEKIGLNDVEIYNLINNIPLKIFKNHYEICDLICKRNKSIVYVDGFYFINNNEHTIKFIISGQFTKNYTDRKEK